MIFMSGKLFLMGYVEDVKIFLKLMKPFSLTGNLMSYGQFKINSYASPSFSHACYGF